ncbi:conserved protein of unknown function [Candidatus Promineifilum breve]|uniref:3-keto-alpha-glucoside-1,2-lyase/3-keto-2-hydroxy-glucal hydratase domain-containing protein n=1 Tax=Candidatus Promineifilum breve TaxID=1806508 RepID=A0A170PDX7_9CHLR|nr:family 16 glycoside hydrolase [Candidatus Promineifilum breve]CUS02253.2 conserved protein of unknown function [Candidatus Promineifilum breve]
MFRSRCRSLGIALLLLLLLVVVACGGRPLLPTGDNAPAAAGEVIDSSEPYSDAFVPGQTGNWLFEQDGNGSTAIVNEQLVVTLVSPNTIQYATLGDRTFDDFVLEVETWQRAGAPESSFGVLFRVQEDKQFYRFDITGNGLFMVERRHADGTWTRLVPDWTPTSALNQGLNVANRLKIIAAGPTLTFYANDVLLTQVVDDTLAAGGIALDAGTFGGGDLQVSFDNLTITPGTP